MSYQKKMTDKVGLDQLVQYKHFVSGKIDIPKSWQLIIKDMLSQIDEVTRIDWLPLSVSNWVNKILKRNYISEIKINFGELKIKGNFNNEVYEIIKTYREICNNTCEVCGHSDAYKTTKKGWVFNLCENCK